MYKVSYYLTGTTRLAFKWFKELSEATTFANTKKPESILEIKFYENSDNHGSTLWS